MLEALCELYFNMTDRDTIYVSKVRTPSYEYLSMCELNYTKKYVLKDIFDNTSNLSNNHSIFIVFI